MHARAGGAPREAAGRTLTPSPAQNKLKDLKSQTDSIEASVGQTPEVRHVLPRLRAHRRGGGGWGERAGGSWPSVTRTGRRIRRNMHALLTKKLMDVIKEYQDAQAGFSTQMRAKVERQVTIVNPDATREEIQSVRGVVGRGGGGVVR